MRTIHTTLGYLLDGENILLAAKKRAFGEGKWNGFGGKQDKGESIEECLVREAQEEICVTPLVWEKVALIEFSEYIPFVEGLSDMANVLVAENGKMFEQLIEWVHVYIIRKWKGEPAETEEMRPAWHSIKNLPFDKMFPDDIYWLSEVIAGKKMKGFFKFDEKFNILDYWVSEAEAFE